MSTNSKVGRNTLYLFISNFLGICIGVGFNVFLARVLGVQRFGEFAFAITFVSLFAVIVEFSLHMLIVRDVARDPAAAATYFGNSLALKGLLFIVACVCAGVTASVLDYPLEVRLLLSILMLSVLFDGVRKCCDALFAAAERMQYSAVVVVAEKALFAILGLVALRIHGSVIAIGLCYVAAHAFSQIISFVLVRQKLRVGLGRVEYGFCTHLAQQAWPFFGISLIAAIYADIDKLFLFSMQDAVAVGLYAAAYRLVTLPTQFSSAFHQAIYPVLSKHAALPDPAPFAETFQRSMRYLMFAAVPLAVGITTLAEPIMRIVYGPAYVTGTVAVQILILAYALEFFNPLFSRVLFIMERQRTVLVIVVLATGVNILLNIILIPIFSITGAAVATLVSASVIFVLLSCSLARSFACVSLGVLAMKTALAGLLMWMVLILLKGMAVIPLAFLGGFVYVACLAVTNAFSIRQHILHPWLYSYLPLRVRVRYRRPIR